MGISEGEEREKETEAINEAIMTENFPQINIRHQTTHPGSSKNNKQDKCPQNCTQAYDIQTAKNQR